MLSKDDEFARVYKLVRPVAVGSTAEVWLASTRVAGLAVTLKILHEHLGVDSDIAARFGLEAQLSMQLAMRGLPGAIDVGSGQGRLYFSYPFVDGENLAAIAWRAAKKQVAIPAAVAASIIAGACRLMAACHSAEAADGKPLGLVHCGLTPQHLLVTHEGDVRIVDVGDAQIADRPWSARRVLNLDRLSYWAPEQWGAGAIDRRTDVFALGVILFELVTGKRLFKHEALATMAEMVMKRDVIAPSKVSSCSPNLDAIILRALEKDPQRRYQTVDELELILRGYLATEPAASGDVAVVMRELFGGRSPKSDVNPSAPRAETNS